MSDKTILQFFRTIHMNSYRLSLRIPYNLEESLANIAEASDQPISEIVRDALQQFVASKKRLKKNKPENCFEAFQKAGLIGCIKKAPNDLSTNKKYFKGFGESSQ